jgi:F0F1-type ATP synthase membrane subunit c/vacuolar-type H+-ATPase subunit K
MSDELSEAGDLTDRFRAFAQSKDPEPSRLLPRMLLVAGIVAVLAVFAVVWMVM